MSEKNHQDFVREHSNKEVICVKCGSSDFNAMRTTPEQIALFCMNCSHSHLLDADMLNGNAVITFWTEIEEEE